MISVGFQAARLPPDGMGKGFSLSLGAGHRLSMICFWQIPAFNWFERVRTGCETSAIRLRGSCGEDCTYLTDRSNRPYDVPSHVPHHSISSSVTRTATSILSDTLSAKAATADGHGSGSTR